MSNFSFIDRDGDEFEAIALTPAIPDSLMELEAAGQFISFYVADASAIIRIIQQAAGIAA